MYFPFPDSFIRWISSKLKHKTDASVNIRLYDPLLCNDGIHFD